MTVLVVCHGNICRSPLAGAVMRRAGLTDVVTAGFKEKEGTKSPKKVRDWAMENERLDLNEHRARAVTEEMLRAAELILYMDNGQVPRLEEKWRQFGLDKEIGPIYARMRPLAAYLATPDHRIGDPMFQKPGTTEFLTIMGQLVEAGGRFAKEWAALKAGDAQIAAAVEAAAVAEAAPLPAEGIGEEAA
jgi:protein-tyrosine-phosphatase